jgi:hypothetical protein
VTITELSVLLTLTVSTKTASLDAPKAPGKPVAGNRPACVLNDKFSNK